MTDIGYLHWCDFLGDDLVALARSTTINNRQRFTATTVTTGVPNFRKSQVLWHDFTELRLRFIMRLGEMMPYIRQAFPRTPQNPEFEVQMTVSGDGDFFKRHTDNGCPATQLRVLTFVYYYTMTDERRFTGGQLHLATKGGDFAIEPTHNSIVIFPSDWMHAIVPVAIPSQQWEDSRMTLNGWIRSKPSAE
jgi:SM-20-related protein